MTKKETKKGKSFIQKLKDGFFLIADNKALFMLIILSTILFMAASVFIMYTYSVQAMQHE